MAGKFEIRNWLCRVQSVKVAKPNLISFKKGFLISRRSLYGFSLNFKTTNPKQHPEIFLTYLSRTKKEFFKSDHQKYGLGRGVVKGRHMNESVPVFTYEP